MTTKEQLQAFTLRVVEAFEAKRIPFPVHLDDGNEDQLIGVFKEFYRPGDWVCGSWRMHYKCLLAGVPEQELFDAVLAGKSIGLCFPEHRVVSSAIVGGILPIAVGIAMGIKRRESMERVLCFLGDMTAETGIFHECAKFVRNFKLPVVWVIEDNGKSVCTDTRQVWGIKESSWYLSSGRKADNVLRYKYESRYPHAGTGKRIEF